MNMLNAIHLLGYAGMWVTGANAYDPEINASLGFEAPSRLVGFLAVGTPRATAAVGAALAGGSCRRMGGFQSRDVTTDCVLACRVASQPPPVHDLLENQGTPRESTLKIMIMGASYGSLLASKVLFGGHSVHLICLPAEADLINSEGFRVRMPIRGRKDPVVIDSRKLPGKVTAGGTTSANPADYDLIGLAMQEPQYRSPGVRELLDAVAKSARALHVDHEHAAAAPTCGACPASTPTR